MQNRGNHSRYPHDGVGSPRNGRNSARYRADGMAARGGRNRASQNAESEYEGQDQQAGDARGRHGGRAAQRRSRVQKNAQQPGNRAQEPLDDWVPIDFEGQNSRSGYGSHRTRNDDTGEWAPIDASPRRSQSRQQGSGPVNRRTAHTLPRDAQPTQRIDAAAVKAAIGASSRAGSGNVPPANNVHRVKPASNPDQAHYKVKKKIPKKHRGLKIAAAVIICLVVIVGAAGGALAFQVKDLRAQASSVMQDASDIQTAFGSSDYAGANQSALDLQSNARSMNDNLQSPLWDAVAKLPVVGSDIENVRTLSAVLSDVTDSAIVPLTNNLAQNPPSSLVSTDGTINVSALNQILASLQQGAPAMQQATDQINAMPAMNISQLDPTVASAKQKISAINQTYQQASSMAPLMGSLLGADGNRTYLLAAQNTAEMRASGGFPGSMGVVNVNNGKISLGEFSTPYTVMRQASGSAVTAEESTLFYDYTKTSWDADYNPDYPRVAGIWAQAFTAQTGTPVDGVISLTPSMVQSILSAVGGSVTLSDGTELDGTNATRVLEHDMYWNYLSDQPTVKVRNPSDVVDGLFAEAAQKTFDQMLAHLDGTTLPKIAETFAQGSSDRTFMLWFSNADEQAQIASMPLSGSLDSATQAAPTLGIFANMWNGCKLGWWLDLDTQVSDPVTAADGSRTYHVTTNIVNNLTKDDLAGGGTYILGPGIKEANGNFQPYIYFYAPAGGSIENLTASNGAPYATATYQGLQVVYTPDCGKDSYAHPDNPIYAGETATVTYDVVLPATVQGDLSVETVPTLTQYR